LSSDHCQPRDLDDVVSVWLDWAGFARPKSSIFLTSRRHENVGGLQIAMEVRRSVQYQGIRNLYAESAKADFERIAAIC
jgi:hypothetical protein